MEHGRRAGSERYMRRAVRERDRGGRGCVPGGRAREVEGVLPSRPPKGAGEPRLRGARGGIPMRGSAAGRRMIAAAEAASRSCVMSGSEWTRAEMRSAWSGPGRGPGKCPRRPACRDAGSGFSLRAAEVNLEAASLLSLLSTSADALVQREKSAHARCARARPDRRPGCWQGVWGIAGGGGSPRRPGARGFAPTLCPMR